MKAKLTILLLVIYSTIASAQFESASYMINGYTLPYQVMFPENYNANQKYPLVILLHGAGERGNDNQKQLTHGKDFLIENFYSNYPAIVIVPQCPDNSFWSNVEKQTIGNRTTFQFDNSDKETPPMETLIALTNNWLNSELINTNQVYIGGLSMGGMGTYELLWRMPDTFAAAFPICGGGYINRIVNNTANTPLWIFHGEADNIVPVNLSRDLVKALKETGNEVKYTEYPNVNHNSWDNAFQEKELAPWLFTHKKK